MIVLLISFFWAAISVAAEQNKVPGSTPTRYGTPCSPSVKIPFSPFSPQRNESQKNLREEMSDEEIPCKDTTKLPGEIFDIELEE